MSRQDLYERIVTSLHAVVFDDARWPATSGLIDEFCATKGNHLVFGDGTPPDDIDILFAQFCYRGQRNTDVEREYFGVYHAVDERLPRIRTLPDGQLASVPSLLGEEERKTSVVYNELMPRTDTLDSLTVRLDGPDGMRIVWTLADPVAGDGWSSAEAGRIERLVPHIRHFVGVRQALVNATALGSSAVELLDNVRLGVIQLDRRGRILAANDRARALMRKGDGLLFGNGTLCAALPEEDKKLQRLLAQALPFRGGPGVGGSMMVSRAGSMPRLVLHVNPVSEDGMELRKSRVGALVLLVDPASRLRIDADRLGDMLGLSPAQSLVAAALAGGKTIHEVAAETGRSPTTIKWHIKNIFAKHGLSGQADLVRLVASLTDAPGTHG